jgi:pimeloyl-ACP methyl ester carboxylesterase
MTAPRLKLFAALARRVANALASSMRAYRDRRMRSILIAGLTACLALTTATSEAQVEFCGPSERPCARIPVALDRSAGVPGVVNLSIERSRATSDERRNPPLFVLAGTPGEAATDSFSPSLMRALLRNVVARRDVVVIDQRGTGASNPLKCAGVETLSSSGVAACAQALGPRRAFYTSGDSVADLEDVRTALGYDRIALLARGYGAKVALDYAAAQPERVERLVLDEPVEPDGYDPLNRASFQASPRIVRELCARNCASFTKDASADFGALLRKLHRGPLEGRVVTPAGRAASSTLTAYELFNLLAAGDASSGLRNRFPSAVHAAVTGDLAPILRLKQLTSLAQESSATTLNVATYVSTVCEETRFPWERDVAPEERRARAETVVAALPMESFAPFDRQTALASPLLSLCERWPASGRPMAATGRLPDVPALLLSGSQSVSTPLETARRVAQLFPRAETLVVNGSVQAIDNPCATSAIRRFLTGVEFEPRCPRASLSPLAPEPTSLLSVRPARGTSGLAGRTLAAVRRTYQDALRWAVDLNRERILRYFDLDALRLAAGGLRSGRFSIRRNNAELHDLELIRGVRVTGRLTDVLLEPDGRLRVSGSAAAHGTLRVHNGRMSGRLGSVPVEGTLGLDAIGLILNP